MNIQKHYYDPRSLEAVEIADYYTTEKKREATKGKSKRFYNIPVNKTVLLFIDSRLVEVISDAISKYIEDLELDNWTVVAKIYVSGDIWDIRETINLVYKDKSLPDLDGVVLIGRIPVPRYYSKGPGEPHWNGYCGYPNTGWTIPPSIFTFFYGNLKDDGSYHKNGTNLVYHIKTPGLDNWTPDIWTSIIRGNWLPGLRGGIEANEDLNIEAKIIKGYLAKNHRIRAGKVPKYKTGLAVSAFRDEQASNYQRLLEMLVEGEVDKHVTKKLHVDAWEKKYDWACLASHGGPTGFLGVWAKDFYKRACQIKFINISACKCGNLDVGRRKLEDCIAQGMVMEPAGDIVTTFSGSELNGGMGDIDIFVESIKRGNTVGKAYADWEKYRWLPGWKANNGDGECGIKWPIERFASIIFGDGSFYYK